MPLLEALYYLAFHELQNILKKHWLKAQPKTEILLEIELIMQKTEWSHNAKCFAPIIF